MTVNRATLVLENVSWRVAGRDILKSIDISFEPGQVHVLAGPNGAGKTSLFRLMAGIHTPTAGRVSFGTREIAGLAPLERAVCIGVHLEAPVDAFGFTVKDIVAMGRHPHHSRSGRLCDADMAAVAKALESMELQGLSSHPYPTLSAGQKQRVGLARLLAQDTPVMLFDEPFARLDPFHVEKVLQSLRDLAAMGRLVVAVVHEPELAARLADRVVLLKDGVVAADGSPSDVFSPEMMATVWGVRAVIVNAADGAGGHRRVIVVTGPT